MDQATRIELEAAAFRRLLVHLQQRTDVQNVDLMGWGGFCRNCISDWLAEEAGARGVALDKAQAREWVYGMPYDEFKARHQTPAAQEQLDRMNASVEQNKRVRGEI